MGPLDLFIFFNLAIISFVFVTFELLSTLLICYFVMFFFFLFFPPTVRSVARTTLAVRWLGAPGTVCPLTPPRCTPSPRPAAQGRGLNRSRGRAQVPAQKPADRQGRSPRAHRARRQPPATTTMTPTAVRDLRTFLSVGECPCDVGQNHWRRKFQLSAFFDHDFDCGGRAKSRCPITVMRLIEDFGFFLTNNIGRVKSKI